jgi:hypothetical protein
MPAVRACAAGDFLLDAHTREKSARRIYPQISSLRVRDSQSSC